MRDFETTEFETMAGVRVPAVTAEEMREGDRIAVDEVGLELLQMMENAGRAFAATLRETAADTERDGRFVVPTGNGGNGGGASVPLDICRTTGNR
ncbi:hypothetical protein [Halogeometricum borinquense]|uniref:hypothetical protein n=1 Tax=Halogeometricum borinquense TaxID=60847 RepID=UPI00019E6E06|nr:hypothetical protein [Halogeometricum borinquense]